MGGGLFTPDRVEQFEFYNDITKKFGAKLFIISCGFQGLLTDNSGNFTIKPIYNKFRDIFETASYISWRSPRDVEICRQIMGNKCIDKIQWHPDLAYGYKPNKQLNVSGRSLSVIIMTSEINSKTRTEFYQKIHELSKSTKLVFIDFGGFSDKGRKTVKKLNQELFTRYPNSILLNLKKPSDICLQTKDYENYKDDIYDFDMARLSQILSKASHVLTSRYHGMILGRVFKVPNIICFADQNYKFTAEQDAFVQYIDYVERSKLALTPLKKVCNWISNGHIFNSVNWSDDDRNTNIVLLNLSSGIEIKKLQGYSNYILENMILD